MLLKIFSPKQILENGGRNKTGQSKYTTQKNQPTSQYTDRITK